jgi:pilus assembly protein Flp/PilA
MTNLIKKLHADKSGASAAEYALIIALVGLAILVGTALLGTEINNAMNDTATAIAVRP